MTEFANKVAELIKDKFESLPKNGKPQSNKEWTVLSAIVQEYKHDLKIVSLCTGTKCLGENKVPYDGSLVIDSHAEVLARKCFLKYLYKELYQCEKQSCSIFEINQNYYQLKTGVEFHLFVTDIPCGDAVIAYQQNIIDRIYRTDAKSLPDAIRFKPGRGDPTLSKSCSDKILKWNYMGIQGALLSIIINKPIYLKSLIIAGGVKLSIDALSGVLNDRFYLMNQFENFGVYSKHKLEIYQSSVEFSFQRSILKKPCFTSICWINIIDKPIEIIIQGRKHGITLKNLNKESSRLTICKKELLQLFKSILMYNTYFKSMFDIEKMTYLESKLLAKEYNRIWRVVKFHIFPHWPSKNVKLLEFV